MKVKVVEAKPGLRKIFLTKVKESGKPYSKLSGPQIAEFINAAGEEYFPGKEFSQVQKEMAIKVAFAKELPKAKKQPINLVPVKKGTPLNTFAYIVRDSRDIMDFNAIYAWLIKEHELQLIHKATGCVIIPKSVKLSNVQPGKYRLTYALEGTKQEGGVLLNDIRTHFRTGPIPGGKTAIEELYRKIEGNKPVPKPKNQNLFQ